MLTYVIPSPHPTAATGPEAQDSTSRTPSRRTSRSRSFHLPASSGRRALADRHSGPGRRTRASETLGWSRAMSTTSPRPAAVRRSSSEGRPRACFTRCGALGWRRTLSTTALQSALTYSAAAAPAIRASNESRPCDCCRRSGLFLRSGLRVEPHSKSTRPGSNDKGQHWEQAEELPTLRDQRLREGPEIYRASFSACGKAQSLREGHAVAAGARLPSCSAAISGCRKDQQWEAALRSLQEAFEKQQLRDYAGRRAGAKRE